MSRKYCNSLNSDQIYQMPIIFLSFLSSISLFESKSDATKQCIIEYKHQQSELYDLQIRILYLKNHGCMRFDRIFRRG